MPMGQLLQLYWWPVGISAELQEKPTYIRLIGEDLVLFRTQELGGIVFTYLGPTVSEGPVGPADTASNRRGKFTSR
jgi:hypothetical protein